MFKPPIDSAATILFELARLRGVRTSKARIRDLVHQHPDAGSLLAMLDAAGPLGMVLEPGRAEDVEVLFEVATPALLFFEAEGQRGFGILEAAGADRLRIRDAVHGVRDLTAQQLAQAWTGIVVEVADAPEPAQPEPNWRLRRVEELLLEDWRVAVDLVGPESSARARTLAAVLGSLLVLACVGLAPVEGRAVTAALALLGVIGLGTSWVMHRRVTSEAGTANFLCGSGGVLNCDSVLLSPWARPAGVPLSDLGVGVFSSWLAVLVLGSFTGSSAGAWVVGCAAAAGVVVALALVVVQALRLRAFCPLCALVHLVQLAALVVFAALVVPGGPPPIEALLSYAAIGLGVAWLGAGVIMPGFAAGARLGWTLNRLSEVGSSPLATLGEWLRHPANGPDPATHGVRLGPADARHTLMILAHPSCEQCGTLLREADQLRRAEPNGFALILVVAPLDPNDPRDIALCARLTAIGLAHGGDAMLSAVFVAKAQLQAALDGDGRTLTDALELDAGAVESQLEHARALAERALLAKTEHAEGIPTMFFDRRRYDGRLTHLQWMLEHDALLDAAIRATP